MKSWNAVGLLYFKFCREFFWNKKFLHNICCFLVNVVYELDAHVIITLYKVYATEK